MSFKIVWKDPYKELPEGGRHVLVCLNDRKPYLICTTYYCDCNYYFSNRDFFDLCNDVENKFERCAESGYKIKAWADLPSPPPDKFSV